MWQFAIQEHIVLSKTGCEAKPDELFRVKHHLLISIDSALAVFCVNAGHSLRGYLSFDEMIVSLCSDRLTSMILSTTTVNTGT
jgi:hypothetical protein